MPHNLSGYVFYYFSAKNAIKLHLISENDLCISASSIISSIILVLDGDWDCCVSSDYPGKYVWSKKSSREDWGTLYEKGL